MTKSIFKDVLHDLNKKLEVEGKRILLLLDNASPHKVDADYDRIHIEFFRPNLTPLLQTREPKEFSKL